MAIVQTAQVIPSELTGPGHWEWQYLDLMRLIWETGSERVDRTGVGTRSICGAMLRFDLADGAMPLLTTKRVYWKTATRELLWFLTGATNIRPLVLQGVKIWNEWPHAHYVRETGDAITLDDFVARIAQDEAFANRWGDLGPVYGRQWVDWPTYRYRADGLYERGEGINQVAAVIKSLQTSPGSRRHIIEGWNVAELDRMALPPCHKTYQFMSRERAARHACPACYIKEAATSRWVCRSTCGRPRCSPAWSRSRLTCCRANWCGWGAMSTSISTTRI